MRSFLTEFIRGFHNSYTVIMMDEDGMDQPRQHQVNAQAFVLTWAGTALLAALLLMVLLVSTPLREFIPGYGTEVMRHEARLNTLRLLALQDSLVAQQQYLVQLRRLLMGQVDPGTSPQALPDEPHLPMASDLAGLSTDGPTEDWADHEQPALNLTQIPLDNAPPIQQVSAGPKYLAALQFPLVPPVNGGYLTRNFDPRTGHFAVDIAIDAGTIVRSIGDGHVIFADWTHEGGYTLAVQHADGYVSVFKHNQRLFKQVGDRVRDREAIAESGNSGEVTTGPHLHFELWHNGLAQDPHYFFLGW